MKNFITMFFVLVFASAVGWYFMPEGWRGKIAGAASIAWRGDKQEVKKYFNDVILPQDPEKRRAVLLDELKKSLAEIKKESTDNLASQNFISTTEKIVKELAEANNDKTFGREVAERVINKIMPVKNETAECKN